MKTQAFRLTAFYAAVSLVVLVTASLRPYYNWDMLPYLACAKELETKDPVAVHAFPYAQIEKRREAGDRLFPAAELDSAVAFRVWMKTDAAAFNDHLAFYRVRIGYTSLIYLMTSVGLDPIFASHFISAFSIFLAIWVLFFIVRGRLAPPFQYAILPLSLGLGMMDAARFSTPDALGFLLTMGSVYLFLRKSPLLFALLPLLIPVKADMLIPVGLFAGAAIALRPKHWVLPALSVLASLGLFFFLQSYYGYPGWNALLHTTFFDKMTFQTPPAFEVSRYLRVLFRGGWSLLRTQEFLFFSAIGGLACYAAARQFKGKPLSAMSASPPLLLLAAAIISAAVRLIIYPQPDTRYLVGQYVIAALTLFMFLTPLVSDPTANLDLFNRKRPANGKREAT